MTAKPPKLLLTGASGFIGRATLAALTRRGFDIRAVSRSHSSASANGVEWVRGDLTIPDGWDRILDGVDVVVHLAGNPGRGTQDDMMRANAEATSMLARAAATAGVSRFVHASTVRIYGQQTHIDEASRPEPQDAYGRSKHAAEMALEAETHAAHGPAVSIVRPPFVFGADRAGLPGLLIRAARYGLPMPLASLHHRRSLICVANIADLFAAAAGEPKEQGSFSLPAGEGTDLTYGELFQRIGEAMGRRSLVFPFPSALLRLAAGTVLPHDAVGRMFSECIVDGSRLAARLDWKPPVSLVTAMRAAVSVAV